MPGQGKIIQAVSKTLLDNGWIVVYKCLPNTPHHNVVPISIIGGTSKQRYPDILAFKDNITKLVEVEPRFNDAVAYDIQTRFTEMANSLSNEFFWQKWSNQILQVCGYTLPQEFIPEYELVICTKIKNNQINLINTLRMFNIQVNSAEIYVL